MKKKAVLIILLIIVNAQNLLAQTNYVHKAIIKLQGSENKESLQINYKQMINYFSHSMNPWDIGSYTNKGEILVNATTFFKSDTLITSSGMVYYSKAEFLQNRLLVIPYGQSEIKKIKKIELENYYIKTLTYTPLLVLEYFNKHFSNLTVQNETENNVTYGLQIGEYYITIYINKQSYKVNKIDSLSAIEGDDQFYGFGDVKDTYIYKRYIEDGKWNIPTQIINNKLNGKLIDTISIAGIKVKEEVKNIIDSPSEFKFQEETTLKPDISVEKYSENIYLINLHHAGTRSLLVEFNDFLLVAESPLNSMYGEQLLAEIRKISPNKPIKYFVFGHFHPHYTGGIRPFIQEGAKVICVKEDEQYIESIATAKHSLRPDKLESNPKKVEFDNIYQAKTITDNSFYMTIYHIGKKSNHTNDYLVYYFPKEKMIFQDDLISITKDTNKSNVSNTTKGFYYAVKDLNLDVKEVVQNWSVFDRKDSMIFKFKDIEKIFNKD